MLKVVGIKNQVGEYNGNPYKNYVLYVVDGENMTSTIAGLCPNTIKVKQSFFKPDFDVKSLYQKDIEVYYDSFGKVAKLEVK